MSHYTNVEIKSMFYSLHGGKLCLSLRGFNYLMFASPKEIHFGGKNCEVSDLRVGGKISFDYDGTASVREITNVTITSDGTREVDADGNLIRW